MRFGEQERRVSIGLEKLVSGGQAVEEMKVVLKHGVKIHVTMSSSQFISASSKIAIMNEPARRR